jgi:molybdopterin molybdotransferase
MNELPHYAAALDLAVRLVSRLGEEDASLERAARRVLARSIVADRDLPPFNRATMDGYAVRASEVKHGSSFPIAAVIAAGVRVDDAIPAGSTARIATGAPVPESLDAVIPHELSDRADPVSFTVDAIDAGHAVHPRASDARRGDLLVAPGTVLGAHHVGLAAMVGHTTLRVVKQPRTTIITSGDEVMPTGSTVQPHQVRNSNGPMIADLLRRFGAGETRQIHAPDEPQPTIDAMRGAIHSSDLVVTIGGVSAGERDQFHAAYAACRVDMPLIGAAIQPGRPIHAGRAPNGTIVVGLPGNPVSALVCAHLFIWPMVRAMQGVNTPAPMGEGADVRASGLLAWEDRALAAEVRPNARRRAFRPARLTGSGSVVVPAWAGSGDLVHTASTHGVIALPIQEEPVPADTHLPFLAWA